MAVVHRSYYVKFQNKSANLTGIRRLNSKHRKPAKLPLLYNSDLRLQIKFDWYDVFVVNFI